MSGAVTISEAPTTAIGKLLTDNRFFVPAHQKEITGGIGEGYQAVRRPYGGYRTQG